MPRRDGTGPFAQRPGTGRGRSIGAGGGMGRMGGNRPGAGPDGYCVCPSCGARVVHQRGVPCYDVKCPKCGSPMKRA